MKIDIFDTYAYEYEIILAWYLYIVGNLSNYIENDKFDKVFYF